MALLSMLSFLFVLWGPRHPIGRPLGGQDRSVVADPIQQGRGELFVSEQLNPFAERVVRGRDRRPACFIPPTFLAQLQTGLGSGFSAP